MKKMINFRNVLIAILCITIIILSIGFIVISMKLNDLENEEQSYNVIFTDISKTSSIKGSNIDPVSKAEITTNHKEIEFYYELNNVNDEVIYTAIIRNDGTMNAKIVDILGSPDYSIDPYKAHIAPVTIELSDIKGKIIEPGRTIELRVSALYNKTTNIIPKKISYKIGLITEYVE